MSEDLVNIEINGRALKARKGAMVIEVADEAGIRIPRFCYHRKLSIAANCRMCLVEVERAPKPLPACATPVTEGMKVRTRSPKALAAQRGTMEFLLINHPLDCPICDQGGECELQDVAVGYGEDVSRYSEAKRVVKDKDIGPLIQTEMTRCIHCTRCVRFGEEIAGMRELGATGRGESMQIGTFVEKSLASELSGNVIDLCPVGALTAKPSRYSARAWELIQHPGVAPHDSVGSNIYLHTLRGEVKRVVPRDEESLNECWISDRDRFSYAGIDAADRVHRPLVKRDGKWQEVDWDEALAAAAEALRGAGGDGLGVLAAPNSTLEELYLVQKIARGLGSPHVDHRLRQRDFSDQAAAPLFPWLGLTVEELEQQQALLLVGSNVRKDQPILAHRIRKAALKGAEVMVVNPRDFGFHFRVTEQVTADPYTMVAALAGVARAALESAGAEAPEALAGVLAAARRDEVTDAMARKLAGAERAVVLLGNLAAAHPALAVLRALCALIAEHTGAAFGYLPEAANSAGAWLAGVLPHREAGGAPAQVTGLDAGAMLKQPRKAYLLLNVEPEFDCEDPRAAGAAMDAAERVVVIAPYASERTRQYADVILPIGSFAETSGTFVNAEGRWQSFNGAARPLGEARPGWKVLRVLGNLLDLPGFEYMSSEEVRDELKALFATDTELDNRPAGGAGALTLPPREAGLLRMGSVAPYRLDNLVRRSAPLQQTLDGQDVALRLHPNQAVALGLEAGAQVRVRQDGGQAILPLIIDAGVPMGCAWIPTGTIEAAALGSGFGPVELEKL